MACERVMKRDQRHAEQPDAQQRGQSSEVQLHKGVPVIWLYVTAAACRILDSGTDRGIRTAQAGRGRLYRCEGGSRSSAAAGRAVPACGAISCAVAPHVLEMRVAIGYPSLMAS
jgi:hypothetical protein